ncbi:MAG: S1 RNA-binding domain-containing protein [Anaerolineae bacterium]|nr:S1 RNA-binding domain-containing protein [Anaerolineae bacterium]
MLFQTQSVLDDVRDPSDTPDSSADFGTLLDQFDYEPPHRGQILESTVLEASHDALILDVGLKRDAIVPRQDLDRIEDETLATLIPGKTIKVWVMRPYGHDGELIVSVNKALELEDWTRANTLLEDGAVVEAPVIDKNRGGILVRFGRLQGFVPNSHLESIRRSLPQEEQGQAKSELLGETLTLKVLEVDRERNRLVLSERAARQESRKARLRQLEPGQRITGTVVHIVDFGAFVDIGGIDGLIHVSRLSHSHVTHPADVLSLGDEVEVLISDVDVDRERISLDRRALLPSPIDAFAEAHQANDLIIGKVTNVVDYGIFVEIAPDVQGLVHVSNMSTLGISHPRHMFQPQDEVLVRIIGIDTERSRVALSIDAVTVAEQQAWMLERHTHEDETEASDEATPPDADADADIDPAATVTPEADAAAAPVSLEHTEADADAPAA